jgi:DNA/RNA-binding domain of Phe-tRNA-synthetase-like protein
VPTLTLSPALADIVRPAMAVVQPVRVVEREARLDAPLHEAAVRMRGAGDVPELTTAVRTMYKRVGIDPTKTRPSSEALWRRLRRGDELPRVNSAVDVVNWCSVESQLPFGLYDVDRIHGDVTLRLGVDGEEYAGIRKDAVHVGGRLTLADDLGAFGNPTSDSARTMVTISTTGVLVVIFAPASVQPSTAEQVLSLTVQRMRQYSGP